MPSRRDFLQQSAAAGLALGLSRRAGADQPSPAQASAATPPRRLKLLILGGTGFIGPWQVRYAVERGHEVTIFNRGRSAPGLFKDVEELTGDRAANQLDALKGRRWDAVIDNSASRADAPDWVRHSAGLLKDTADQYLLHLDAIGLRRLESRAGHGKRAAPDPGEHAELEARDALSLRTVQGTGRGRSHHRLRPADDHRQAGPDRRTR